jgi:hypothetical protein
MNAFADKSFTRNLTAGAVATLLAMSLGTGYAADEGKHEGIMPPAKAQGQLSERATVAEFQGWEDPDVERIAVHGGRALLRHVRAAHAALEENKLGEARSSLIAADDFAEGLQLMIPYTVVVDKIRDAKHELLATSTGVMVDDLLPIYASIDEMADYAPELAKKAKGKLDEAVKHMQEGKKGDAAEKLHEIEADISATAVYLPVLYVEKQVEGARAALDKDPPDLKVAKTHIDRAMESLVHATVNMVVFPNEQAAGKPGTATPAPAPQAKEKTPG